MSHSSTRASQRIFGLDVLRTMAVFAVTFHHMDLSSQDPFARLMTLHGWSGVDLFFVLSGYLIGGQLFARLAKDQTADLATFYWRRFVRTLPNYWFVLIVCYVLWPSTPFGSATPLWRYLTFTQNLSPLEVFEPSWSLCVEEHFYLLFPPLALLAFRYAGPGGISRSIMRWALRITIAGIVARGAIWFWLRPDIIAHTSPDQAYEEYSTWIYNFTPMHLDGIVWGVALGCISVFRKDLWDQALKRAPHFAALGTVFLGAAILSEHVPFIETKGLMGLSSAIFNFPLLALGFSCWMIPAIRFKNAPAQWLGKLFEVSAQLSYAIYLLNLIGIGLIVQLAPKLGIDPHGYAAATLSIVVITALSFLLYWTIEKPALKLRDKGRLSAAVASAILIK